MVKPFICMGILNLKIRSDMTATKLDKFGHCVPSLKVPQAIGQIQMAVETHSRFLSKIG